MTAEELKILADSEMETGRSLAIGFGIVSIAFLLILGMFFAVTLPDLLLMVFLLTVGMGASAATGVLLWAWRRRNALVEAFREYCMPAPVAPLALPDALPALPQENRIISVTAGDRVGDVAIDLVHGFDPRDLEWLCHYIAKGGAFTEAVMEFIPLPYSFEMMGKAQAGTNYTKFMRLCVDAGVIVGRKGKHSGTLAIANYTEIVRRIKELPESIDPARAG